MNALADDSEGSEVSAAFNDKLDLDQLDFEIHARWRRA